MYCTYECSSLNHTKEWLERRKQQPDNITLEECFVIKDVVLLDLLVTMPMDLVLPPCLHLFGCLLRSDFMKGSRVRRQLLFLAFLSNASRPSSRDGWYSLRLLVGVERHCED